MNLLIDIGNTCLKWCQESELQLGKVNQTFYKNSDILITLESVWKTLQKPEQIAVSCVAEPAILHSIERLAETLWGNVNILFAKSTRTKLSVTNAYRQPEKLGVDRWMALLALRTKYPGKSCVIDCGTAITIDCLDEKGHHLGGLICPGINLMKASLFRQTFEIQEAPQQAYPVQLSNFTESAIYSGTVFAAAGLIEKSLLEFCHAEHTILTGGDAKLLSEYIKLPFIIEPDLVLQGLALYCLEENTP